MKNDCLSMAIPVVAPEHKVMLTIEIGRASCRERVY